MGRAIQYLQPGDELVYKIDDQRVILTKARRGGKTGDPFRMQPSLPGSCGSETVCEFGDRRMNGSRA